MASLQVLRHATLLLELGGVTFLVDPMLDPARARPAIVNSPEPERNPLVELPEPPADIVARAEAVVVTHLHADHLDATAAEIIGDRLPVFCQPGDAATIIERGMTNTTEIDDRTEHQNVTISRTNGRHGTGATADMLGPVSGFVFASPGEPTVYVAGDTVFCVHVETAIEAHQPDVIVVNAGGARFLDSDLITMGVTDVLTTEQAGRGARIIAVHMGAINHCQLTRSGLRAATAGRVAVPADGERITLGGP
jgi:L-ascorbate metabolism protein UlaG (beta-lactamase superfamily)